MPSSATTASACNSHISPALPSTNRPPTRRRIAVDCQASVQHINGRLIACCEIDHFLLSGLTVPDLFTRLRPDLTAAIEAAAMRDPQINSASRKPSVQMDFEDPDPGITLLVHSPAAALLDLGACFDSLQAIVTRFTADETTAEGGAA